MRVLVTGAAGFVGQHLIRELLVEGATIFGATLGGIPPDGGTLSSSERLAVGWLPVDITDVDTLQAAVQRVEPERVYHLAGQSSVARSFREPLETWDVNATGTLNLLEVLRHLDTDSLRVLIVSSAEVYGPVPEDEQPIREERPLRPASPYAASKAAAEMVGIEASAKLPSGVVVARSFNHTGPGQDPSFALPGFARQLAEIRAGEREAVLRVGNLEVWRDFLDVRDVARAYLTLMEKGGSGTVYNVCSGEAPKLEDLVVRLVQLSGAGARVEVEAARFRPVDVRVLRGCADRLTQLGWHRRFPLDETLHDLLAEYGLP